MSIQNESVLAVIGGGRWGQVILSILGNMFLSFDRVVVVSKLNIEDINHKLEELKYLSSTLFSSIDTIENLLAQYHVKAAIIVNSARQHFDTALYLINHGVHILIEKPITLSAEHMHILIESAHQNEVCVYPGLCYRFCTYLDTFAKIIADKGVPSRFVMEWHDMAGEIRYDKIKKHDPTINIAQDVMPHVWSILSKIFHYPLINIHTCVDDGVTNDYAKFEVSLNNISGEVILKRHTSIRQRSILVEFPRNKFCKIDFSKEPGMIFTESNSFSADINWSSKLSPITQQLNHYFSYIQIGKLDKEVVETCLYSVLFSESASILLQKHKDGSGLYALS